MVSFYSNKIRLFYSQVNFHVIPMSKAPESAFLVCRSKHLDEARSVLSKVYCKHKLEISKPKHELNLIVEAIPLPHSTIIYNSFGAAVMVDVGEPGTLFTSQLIPTGAAEYKIGNQRVHATSKNKVGAMISPTRNVRIHPRENTGILGFRIDRSFLEQQLEALIGVPLLRPLEFEARLDLSHGLVRHHARLLMFQRDEIIKSPELLEIPLVLANIEQSLLTGLLEGAIHNYSQYLDRSKISATPRQVIMVEDYLESHAQEAVEVTTLSKITGYSVSAIYQSFKKYRGYTPMGFLKRTRLLKFHDSLLAAPPEASVTRMGMGWGFTHFGRLASDYRRQFGELPSETLRKGKSRKKPDFPRNTFGHAGSILYNHHWH